MKGLKKILFNSKQDILTEKAFTQSIAVSVIGIILCLVALSSATWAWFSASVSSGSNSIQSANCTVSVSVTKDGATITPVDGKYTEGDYTITITAIGTAETAYCILKINDTDYYTKQISTTEPNNMISFTLTFETQTEVEIITRWGTSSQTNRTFAHGAAYTVDKDDNGHTTITPVSANP